MRTRIPLTLAGVTISCLTFTGCAMTEQSELKPVSPAIQLAGLPAGIVDVQVYDLRPETLADDRLKDLLRSQVEGALGEEPSGKSRQRYRLSIDIVEHRSFITSGNCNACTRLRVKLLAGNGGLLNAWDVLGTAERPEGGSAGEAVSSESYSSALANLMSTLSQVSVMR